MKIFLALLFILPQLLHAQEIPEPVREKLRAANIPESDVAIFVQDAGGASPLTLNADRPMNPASVMKLVTTYSALEMLGPDYRWKTEVYLSGKLAAGTLHGDLVFRGYGDPKLTVENFWLLLRELKARGLEKIDGNLILDRSYFAIAAQDAGSFDGKPWRPYNVIPDALLLNFQATALNFAPDGKKVRVLLDPDFGNMQLTNKLKLSSGPCRFWEDGISQGIETDGKNTRLTLSGIYPESCGEKADAISTFDHSLYFERLFKMLWQQLGGKIAGHTREEKTPENASLFYTFQSPTLSSILVDINKYSNNVMARQLFLTLGEGNNDRAAAAVKNWLAANRLDFPELTLENGCGLSRVERISARHLGELLLLANQSPLMPEWVSSLPLVGMDGTMKKRLAGSIVSGHAHIKTGYLEGVRSIAGFVRSKSGKTLVVVGIVNGPKARESKAALDALLEWAAEN